ncbi:hypothetical protein CYMTET_44637 [Cymbomonas tetramitiformis]|uniref:Uncharacterized protein n=1 Tax=Cymbomonas tetramitiformis TaxID=36881 RepID=A0AAE0BZV0_9CHLO|nr:hypothetical protein CYMTET_44637 [Cymbomonas tetramitiformis]
MISLRTLRGHIVHHIPRIESTAGAADPDYEYHILPCEDCASCVFSRTKRKHTQSTCVLVGARIPCATVVAAVSVLYKESASSEMRIERILDVRFPANVVLCNRSLTQKPNAAFSCDLLSRLHWEIRHNQPAYNLKSSELLQRLQQYTKYAKSAVATETISIDKVNGFHKFVCAVIDKRISAHGTRPVDAHLNRALHRNVHEHVHWSCPNMTRSQYVSIAIQHGAHKADLLLAMFHARSTFTFFTDEDFSRILAHLSNSGDISFRVDAPLDEERMYHDQLFRLVVGISLPMLDYDTNIGRLEKMIRGGDCARVLRVTRYGSEDLCFNGYSCERIEHFPITAVKLQRLKQLLARTTDTDGRDCQLVVDARCPLLRVALYHNRKRGSGASRGTCIAHIRCTALWTDDETFAMCVHVLLQVACTAYDALHVRLWSNGSAKSRTDASGERCTRLESFVSRNFEVAGSFRNELNECNTLLLKRIVEVNFEEQSSSNEVFELGLNDLPIFTACDTCKEEFAVGGWIVNVKLGIAGIVRDIIHARTGNTKRRHRRSNRGAGFDTDDDSYILKIDALWSPTDLSCEFFMHVSVSNRKWTPCGAFPIICAHQLPANLLWNRIRVYRHSAVQKSTDLWTSLAWNTSVWMWLPIALRLCRVGGLPSMIGVVDDTDEAKSAELYILQSKSDLAYASTDGS